MIAMESLEAKKKIINQALARYLPADDSSVAMAMRYSVLGGGKRFRPLLLLAVGEALGSRLELLLPYACAIESIHNYSLIHDDLPCMDNDDFRRGELSCHKKFGETAAVLAGDGLLSLAFEILAFAPCLPSDLPAKEKACQEIATAAGFSGLIKGQWMDLFLSRQKVTEEVLVDLIKRKTGSLIRASVRTGAIIAGADARTLEHLSEFGDMIGLAFQLKDDLEDEPQSKTASGISAVTVIGADKAKKRLMDSLMSALDCLKKAGLNSEELNFLVLSLQV